MNPAKAAATSPVRTGASRPPGSFRSSHFRSDNGNSSKPEVAAVKTKGRRHSAFPHVRRVSGRGERIFKVCPSEACSRGHFVQLPPDNCRRGLSALPARSPCLSRRSACIAVRVPPEADEHHEIVLKFLPVPAPGGGRRNASIAWKRASSISHGRCGAYRPPAAAGDHWSQAERTPMHMHSNWTGGWWPLGSPFCRVWLGRSWERPSGGSSAMSSSRAQERLSSSTATDCLSHARPSYSRIGHSPETAAVTEGLEGASAA